MSVNPRPLSLNGQLVISPETVAVHNPWDGAHLADVCLAGAPEIDTALARAGFTDTAIRTVLSPAWTTDWLTPAVRQKLLAYGIAPPDRATGRCALFGEARAACPRCGSADTELLAEFGSTACKSLYRCRSCREPFDAFKCH